MFDPSDETQPPKHKQLLSRLIAAAKAHPFPAFAVLALLGFSIIALIGSISGGGAQPTPITVSVPAATPVTVPAANASAPPPSSDFANAAAPAPVEAIPAGPSVLPPTFPLDRRTRRGGRVALAMDTDSNAYDQVLTWVELGVEPLAETDAIASLTFARLAERFNTVWPGPGADLRLSVSGLARIEDPGNYVAIVNVKDRGECKAEFGPAGNEIARATFRAGVSAAPLALEAGLYQVALTCDVDFWLNLEGNASLSLRKGSGQPKMIELFEAIEEADAADAPT